MDGRMESEVCSSTLDAVAVTAALEQGVLSCAPIARLTRRIFPFPSISAPLPVASSSIVARLYQDPRQGEVRLAQTDQPLESFALQSPEAS